MISNWDMFDTYDLYIYDAVRHNQFKHLRVERMKRRHFLLYMDDISNQYIVSFRCNVPEHTISYTIYITKWNFPSQG